MKRLKAFTLVELIVVIAIFGLLMAGIMNMVAPIQSAATESKVLNAQKSLEESVTTYLGENLRYATNLLVVEGGAQVGTTVVDSPAKAIEAFYAFAPINSFGQPYAYNDDSKKNTHVIVWESTKEHSVMGGRGKFYGRMLRSTNSSNNITGIGDTLIASDGSKPLYTVFGDPYYSTSNTFLKVEMIDGGANGYLKITCNSDYYYTASGAVTGSKKHNNDSGNPTVTTFELRNMGTKSTNQFKFHMAAKTNVGNGISADRSDLGSSGKVIYFVYTDSDSEDWTVDMSRTDTVGTNYKDGSKVEAGGGNGSNTGNTGSNTGNTGSNTGNTGSNTGNTGSNTGNTGGNTGNTGGNTGNTGGNTGNTGGNTGNTGNENGNSGNQGGNGQKPDPTPSGGTQTVGHATATVVTSGKGVYGMSESGDTVTVKVGNDQWNQLELKITKNSNGEYTYKMEFGNDSKYIIQDGPFPDIYANSSYNLNAEQIKWLKDNFGLTLD